MSDDKSKSTVIANIRNVALDNCHC